MEETLMEGTPLLTLNEATAIDAQLPTAGLEEQKYRTDLTSRVWFPFDSTKQKPGKNIGIVHAKPGQTFLLMVYKNAPPSSPRAEIYEKHSYLIHVGETKDSLRVLYPDGVGRSAQLLKSPLIKEQVPQEVWALGGVDWKVPFKPQGDAKIAIRALGTKVSWSPKEGRLYLQFQWGSQEGPAPEYLYYAVYQLKLAQSSGTSKPSTAGLEEQYVRKEALFSWKKGDPQVGWAHGPMQKGDLFLVNFSETKQGLPEWHSDLLRVGEGDQIEYIPLVVVEPGQELGREMYGPHAGERWAPLTHQVQDVFLAPSGRYHVKVDEGRFHIYWDRSALGWLVVSAAEPNQTLSVGLEEQGEARTRRWLVVADEPEEFQLTEFTREIHQWFVNGGKQWVGRGGVVWQRPQGDPLEAVRSSSFDGVILFAKSADGAAIRFLDTWTKENSSRRLPVVASAENDVALLARLKDFRQKGVLVDYTDSLVGIPALLTRLAQATPAAGMEEFQQGRIGRIDTAGTSYYLNPRDVFHDGMLASANSNHIHVVGYLPAAAVSSQGNSYDPAKVRWWTPSGALPEGTLFDKGRLYLTDTEVSKGVLTVLAALRSDPAWQQVQSLKVAHREYTDWLGNRGYILLFVPQLRVPSQPAAGLEERSREEILERIGATIEVFKAVGTHPERRISTPTEFVGSLASIQEAQDAGISFNEIANLFWPDGVPSHWPASSADRKNLRNLFTLAKAGILTLNDHYRVGSSLSAENILAAINRFNVNAIKVFVRPELIDPSAVERQAEQPASMDEVMFLVRLKEFIGFPAVGLEEVRWVGDVQGSLSQYEKAVERIGRMTWVERILGRLILGKSHNEAVNAARSRVAGSLPALDEVEKALDAGDFKRVREAIGRASQKIGLFIEQNRTGEAPRTLQIIELNVEKRRTLKQLEYLPGILNDALRFLPDSPESKHQRAQLALRLIEIYEKTRVKSESSFLNYAPSLQGIRALLSGNDPNLETARRRVFEARAQMLSAEAALPSGYPVDYPAVDLDYLDMAVQRLHFRAYKEIQGRYLTEILQLLDTAGLEEGDEPEVQRLTQEPQEYEAVPGLLEAQFNGAASATKFQIRYPKIALSVQSSNAPAPYFLKESSLEFQANDSAAEQVALATVRAGLQPSSRLPLSRMHLYRQEEKSTGLVVLEVEFLSAETRVQTALDGLRTRIRSLASPANKADREWVGEAKGVASRLDGELVLVRVLPGGSKERDEELVGRVGSLLDQADRLLQQRSAEPAFVASPNRGSSTRPLPAARGENRAKAIRGVIEAIVQEARSSQTEAQEILFTLDQLDAGMRSFGGEYTRAQVSSYLAYLISVQTTVAGGTLRRDDVPAQYRWIAQDPGSSAKSPAAGLEEDRQERILARMADAVNKLVDQTGGLKAEHRFFPTATEYLVSTLSRLKPGAGGHLSIVVGYKEETKEPFHVALVKHKEVGQGQAEITQVVADWRAERSSQMLSLLRRVLAQPKVIRAVRELAGQQEVVAQGKPGAAGLEENQQARGVAADVVSARFREMVRTALGNLLQVSVETPSRGVILDYEIGQGVLSVAVALNETGVPVAIVDAQGRAGDLDALLLGGKILIVRSFKDAEQDLMDLGVTEMLALKAEKIPNARAALAFLKEVGFLPLDDPKPLLALGMEEARAKAQIELYL